MEEEQIQEGQENKESIKKVKLEKHQAERLKGRVIIINPEQSEFGKHLGLIKRGDYAQKSK